MTTIVIPAGRLVRDIATKTGTSGEFGTFSLAVDQDYGEKKTTGFYNCSVNSDVLASMTKASVKQGSLISLSGSFKLRPYMAKDGVTKRVSPSLTVHQWQYVPRSKKKEEEPSEAEENLPVQPDDVVNLDDEDNEMF